MVLTLTDLKWDMELFLFGSGFTKFWKLSVGGVVAILNPGIMKPRVKDSGKFSLVLGSDEDTVLEIGQARDLGWCKTVKKDASRCGMWIDKRRTEVCAWHVEMAVKNAQNQRMELNNTGKLFSPPRKRGLRNRQPWLSRGGGGGGGGKIRDDGLLPYNDGGGLHDLPQRLGGAGGKVFVLPNANNTNAIFDDSFQDAFHNGTREERLKRQLDKSQRERDVAKRLVEAQKMLGGHAEDYSSLLKANRANLASAVKLSPIKRPRHLSHPYSQLHPAPPPPPLEGDAAHKHKKPKTVHFQRPVVTGGAGAGRGWYEDGDDDLEIC
ncbi:Primase zinc finger-domain-containing protein [Terfezia claveryi]|nr:Primase zinc finger-domain-containing protein [Terfezia claveryi]